MSALQEIAPTLEEIRQESRREGMADAVVRIVLSRRFPHVDAAEWCNLLGLTSTDIQAATARLSETTRLPVGATSRLAVAEAPIAPKPCRRGPSAGPRPRRSLMHDCPFCERRVQQGKRWTDHMAAYHADDWAAHLSAKLTEKHGAECPDCGERIGVTVAVTVDHHCCAAKSEVEAG